MSKELQELRDQRGTEGFLRRRGSTTESQSQGSSDTTPRPYSQEIMIDEFDLDMDSVQLDDIVVEAQAVIELFKM